MNCSFKHDSLAPVVRMRLVEFLCAAAWVAVAGCYRTVGRYCLDILWNVTDVRDIGETQRLMAESPIATNGSRYARSRDRPAGSKGLNIYSSVVCG